MKAHILNLQRLSTEDGPGIRTTIFFKGCPLQCVWCHNPESIHHNPQVQWHSVRCIGCLSCIPICPLHAISRSNQGEINIDRQLCDGCGLCVDACPTTALEILGKDIEVEELVGELLKDAAFYETSGGGITASGGEPTLQPEIVATIFQEMQSRGIHTALDTCGYCSQEALKKILPWTDLVLFDLKSLNPEDHETFTGKPNQRIIENLLWLRDQLKTDQKFKVWLRTPLIPGFTAQEENIRKIGEFIFREMDQYIERWELCSFNNLCQAKYERLGIGWQLSGTPLLTQEELDLYGSIARSSGVSTGHVYVTGAARQAE